MVDRGELRSVCRPGVWSGTAAKLVWAALAGYFCPVSWTLRHSSNSGMNCESPWHSNRWSHRFGNGEALQVNAAELEATKTAATQQASASQVQLDELRRAKDTELALVKEDAAAAVLRARQEATAAAEIALGAWLRHGGPGGHPARRPPSRPCVGGLVSAFYRLPPLLPEPPSLGSVHAAGGGAALSPHATLTPP